MNISDNFRNLIVKEINYVVKQMEQSSIGEKKLYYFSGIYSMIQRIFNLEYDSELVYAHFILNGTYNSFAQRIEAMKGGQSHIPITEAHFELLTAISKELAEKIKEKKSIDNTLKQLTILSYTLSGNGYYLQQKGILKI